MYYFLLVRKYCIWIIFAMIVGNAGMVVYSDTAIPAARGSLLLDNRHANSDINKIFKNNILLTLSYMSGKVKDKSDIDWNEIAKPSEFKIKIDPNSAFAFHDTVLAQYRNKNLVGTNAHFSSDEGFLSSGYLYGDGVCHLASLINKTAIQAGLNTESPVNHDFAKIPDIEQKYGVSIYTSPANPQNSSAQNLYIENNTGKPVYLVFNYNQNHLELEIIK